MTERKMRTRNYEINSYDTAERILEELDKIAVENNLTLKDFYFSIAGEDYGYFEYKTPETDAEVASRLQVEKSREAYERAQYEKLRKKYEQK